jgi:hypothetical protein
MAIVKFGGGVSGIRGTIAGITFTANKAGPYAKAWSRCANIRTQPQTADRAALATLAARWRTLDPGDQADWNTFAADPQQELTNPLGETYYISGFLWWVKMSEWLRAIDRDPIQTAPLAGPPPAPTVLTLTVSAGDVASEITYALNEFGPAFDCFIKLCIGQSTGAYSMPVKPTCLPGWQIPGASPLDISTEVNDAFPTLQLGQKAFAEIYRQTGEGYRSSPFAIAADVVA